MADGVWHELKDNEMRFLVSAISHKLFSSLCTKQIPVIGIGRPVGSGKTALVEALCRK